MSGISLQFGPEWMRSKQASTPSSIIRPSHSILSPVATQMPGSSLYSSFVTSNASEHDKDSSGPPFKYSKEEMLQVWTDGGGRGALGVEVELWDGVVKELAGDPIGLKEFSELEKKLFSTSLNSEVRRRQSHDILPNSLERPKLSLSASNIQTSFGQSRFSPLLARRKKEEPVDLNVSALRRSSLSGSLSLSPAGGPMSPSGGLPSPRTKLEGNSLAHDNIIGDGSWRKKGERRGDVPDGTPALIDYSNSGNAIIEAFTQVQAALHDDPSLDSTTETRNGVSKLDDYHPPVLKNNDGFSMAHPPGFDPDPASFTWVYRDPKGNIQGPFSASLMQKWYDEGYFAPDLLVRRSQSDNEWITVGELAMHARSGKLFFQVYLEHPSPGSFPKNNLLQQTPQPLNHFRSPPTQSESQVMDYATNQSMFQQHNSPHYVGVSDSYTNASPLLVQSPPSILGMPSSPEFVFKGAVPNRIPVSQPIFDRPTSFEHATSPRNGYGRLDHTEFSHPALIEQFQAFSGSQDVHSNDGSADLTRNRQSVFTGSINPQDGAVDNTKVPFNRTLFESPKVHSINNFAPSSSALHVPLSNPDKGQALSEPSQPKLLPHSDDAHRKVGFVLDTPISLRQPPDNPFAPTEESSLPLLDQYTPLNSQLYSSSDSIQAPVSITSLASKASATETNLSENTELINSPRYVGEVPMPNQIQQRFFSEPENGIIAGGLSKMTENFVQTEKLASPYVAPEVARKEPRSVLVAHAATPYTMSSSVPVKQAWKNPIPPTDDVKPGLREIQEAEARKSEARKLAERDKDWNVRSINALPEDPPLSPSVWGLPVSHAGSSRPTPTQQQSSPPSAQPAPVWINTGKPVQLKQTMKEIQEEEELKKKVLIKEKDPVQNKRAYAESANKSNLQASGGVWTTVGVGGRHAPSSTTQPIARQTASATATTTSQPMKSVVNRPLSSTSVPSAKVTPRSISSSVDDTPVPPSPEFIKWLRDALRGFNAGFNTEEFMTMLLAFPLDFPPSTVEVIQDMVYMNSVTMDGRRFAAEFCSKRKNDAANRPGNTNGRQLSLAEVVKTQPKPVQSELPFKVVKKKGKGNPTR